LSGPLVVRVYEEYMLGASEVYGRWMRLAIPIVCLSVRGALGSGWIVRVQSFPMEGSWRTRVLLPAGLAALWPLYMPVRGCPQDRRRRWPGARTYNGQRARRNCQEMSFSQVTGHIEVQVGAAVKPSAQPTLVRTHTCHHLRKRPPGCGNAARRAVSFLSRRVSGCVIAGRCVAAVADIWRTASGRNERCV
jgi:hypothetical protein